MRETKKTSQHGILEIRQLVLKVHRSPNSHISLSFEISSRTWKTEGVDNVAALFAESKQQSMPPIESIWTKTAILVLDVTSSYRGSLSCRSNRLVDASRFTTGHDKPPSLTSAQRYAIS